ncbi:MAG: hypothetical protein RLZZ08_1648 [Pseudomonadota bacterium]|jgi:hypothetical protein
MDRPLPRDQRKITFTKAFMAVGEGWSDVTIGNMSAHGMMVKCADPPAVGASVTIRRRGAAATGIVQWVNGRRFGLHSHDPIDIAGFNAESAAEASQREASTMAAPRLVERVWHWRSRD